MALKKKLHLKNGTAYIIARLKEMTMPELLDAIAEAHSGETIDIYEYLEPTLIDKTTDMLYEIIDAVKSIKKENWVFPLNILLYLYSHENHYKRNDGKRCGSC